MNQSKLRVVITDCDHGSIEEEVSEIGRIDADLSLLQAVSEEELVAGCRPAEGIINQYAQFSRRVLEALPRCRVIARYGVGVDNIDLQAATELGIIVANVPDYCIDEVADHTVALLLTLIRKTAFFDRAIKSGSWDFRQGIPIPGLKGKTMGLVGSGKIGLGVSQRLAPFGVRVIAFDPYVNQAGFPLELVALDKLLAESDFISIHCPLTEKTRHLLNGDAFGKMAKRPIVLNSSRGAIIEEDALINALQTGKIAAAGLDVLEREPPGATNPLLRMDNVVLTPHVGFYSVQSIRELKRRTAGNVAAVLTGKWPSSVVNKEVTGKTRANLA